MGVKTVEFMISVVVWQVMLSSCDVVSLVASEM